MNEANLHGSFVQVPGRSASSVRLGSLKVRKKEVLITFLQYKKKRNEKKMNEANLHGSLDRKSVV